MLLGLGVMPTWGSKFLLSQMSPALAYCFLSFSLVAEFPGLETAQVSNHRLPWCVWGGVVLGTVGVSSLQGG